MFAWALYDIQQLSGCHTSRGEKCLLMKDIDFYFKAVQM